MELSKLALDGISTAGNTTEISDQSYNLILNDIFETTTSVKNLKAGNKNNIRSSTEKAAHSGLLSLVLEAAKHNVDSSSISSVLEDCRWDVNRISSFINKFQEDKEKIQSALSMIGKSYNHIVGVQWRQDFRIKSNNCEKICEPSYIISLEAWNPHINSGEDITFSCNMEQLEDLVLKLKDATKCIERNAV
ncbi:COMM domain-containing protein 3-like isoform X1 [Argiope bruennichi]|uniref:COMM domain-containing protein 3-like isoform X1 n=1 Tax=Argiope bruennichi TaxID=94029 RepID=UPI00249476A7|nr:COMM domain-containing protein 3-like isoform X1 [Argiope bruennichi]